MFMRVTAGQFKGRKLLTNTFDHIRPTADIVKQAIFNKLAFKISSSSVLDLFCGTGALGIEAISRGASRVVFVDKDYRSVNLTKANLKNLNIDAEVLRASFDVALARLKGEKFDIIILDPPYKAGLYEKALSLICEYRLLSEGGVIVAEHAKDEKIDFSLFSIETSKDYGSKSVTYLIEKN